MELLKYVLKKLNRAKSLRIIPDTTDTNERILPLQ